MPKEIPSNLMEDDTLKRIRKFRILNLLTPDELRLLLGTSESEYHKRISKIVTYQPKETVIREGDFDSWIFWVVQGEFAVFKKNVLIALFNEPGEVFGEMSSIDEDSRSATVIAREKSICLSIDMSILDSIPNLCVKEKIRAGMYSLKSERLNQTTSKLVAEKKRVIEQQKQILVERLKLIEKEDQLKRWEQDLSERETRLCNYACSINQEEGLSSSKQ
ncbi:MAG: cyclic nucleotide-binding domain-containing protein [Desulfobacteraceae bacterium]|jgi:CRP-like cAMP-binding protein